MLRFASDVRFALRLLLKRPGFAAVAILTLALGIGATTAIFTVVHAILLSPLPFPDPDRLAAVGILSRDGENFPLPDTDFVAWRDQNRTADAIAVWAEDQATLTGDAAAERVDTVEVTDRFFDVLGARPLVGRVFQAGDDQPAAAKTLILSHGFWMRRYHGDPNVVGQTLALGGVAHTIIGVMPASFTYPHEFVALWQILTIKPPPRRGPFYSHGIARLKPNVRIDELRANLGVITRGLMRQYPAPEDWTLDAVPLHESVVGRVKQVLWVLFGAVGFLLLIATANVANLLLARAATREREMALRGALGAGRARIVGQLLTESVVLAVLSGALGLAMAYWGTRGLLALAPENIPRLGEVRMNVPVFLFALACAAICGVVFGLVPAFRAARTPLVETLKEGGRGGIGAGHRRVQRALVVAEIALALVLSAGAGLMMRSLAALARVSPGFDPGHLLTFQVSLPQSQYPETPQVRGFYDPLIEKLAALPGVRAAALAISLPPNLLQITDNFMVEGQVLPPNQSAPLGPVVMVSDEYFTALGVPLVRGRFFDGRDEEKAPPAVIINDTLARKFFAGVDPIGRRFKIGGPERPIGPNNPWMTVVGVVGDVKYSGLDAAPEPTYYMPYRQSTWHGQYVVVRAAGDPRTLAASAREIVASLDRNIPVTAMKTMDELMVASTAPPRFRTTLVAVFALLGLLLAAIGIYGVMAHAVAERTHELGVRIALGADRAAVLRLVLGEAFALAAAGIVVGLAGAFAVARLIQSLLFGVASTDALTFAGISVLLAATALVASYVPARRAVRVDPMVALRYE